MLVLIEQYMNSQSLSKVLNRFLMNTCIVTVSNVVFNYKGCEINVSNLDKWLSCQNNKSDEST